MYYANSRLGDQPHEMMLVAAGEFAMGTNDRFANEGLVHSFLPCPARIDAF